MTAVWLFYTRNRTG